MARRVPRFVLNLDLAPEERWNEVIDLYRDSLQNSLKRLVEDVRSSIGSRTYSLVESLAIRVGRFSNHFVIYRREIRAIAKRAGIDEGLIVLLQFVYEVAAACTSVVVPLSNTNEFLHCRTMDWAMPFLKDLTIELDVRCSGQTLFLATTWPGCVGIFTGMRMNNYSISINFRVIGDSYWTNLRKLLSSSWPPSFLVRAVLTEDTTYQQALSSLSDSNLVAPVYFTLCGTIDAALITRDRNGVAPIKNTTISQEKESSLWLLSERGNIVQPNIDWFDSSVDNDILWSLERRRLARAKLERHSVILDLDKLLQLYSMQPIFNQLTIYGTFMQPSTGLYLTLLPHDRYGFLSSDNHLESRQLPDISIGLGQEMIQEYHRVKICLHCQRPFSLHEVQQGHSHCNHIGEWHSSYSQCSWLKCGLGLRLFNIGHQHWSCCFSTDYHSGCIKAPPHQALPSS